MILPNFGVSWLTQGPARTLNVSGNTPADLPDQGEPNGTERLALAMIEALWF